MLAYIVAAVGALVVLIGVAVMFLPGAARELVTLVQGPRVLYGAVGFRVVAGAFFIVASDACSWPLAIGTVGVLVLAAGLAGMFIGLQRLEAMMAWFMRLSDGVWRAGALIAVIFGAFTVYAAVL